MIGNNFGSHEKTNWKITEYDHILMNKGEDHVKKEDYILNCLRIKLWDAFIF